MLSVKYLDRIDITFLPTDAIAFAEQIGATKATRPGIVYEMHLSGNPRNREGYRSKLDADIRKLRQQGAVLVDVPNADGKKFLADRTAKQKEESFPTIGSETEKSTESATKHTGKSK